MKHLLVIAALVVGGCGVDHAGHGGGAAGSGGNGNTGNGTGGGAGGTGSGGGAQGCTKMDILFVVDNSGSMQEEQTNLGANFPKFIDVLNAYMTGAGAGLDYHVGLTTTSLSDGAPPIPLPIPLPVAMADDGAMRNQSSCGMTRPWIERTDNNPAMQFSCVAKVGTDGSGHEQPLSAAKLALTDRIADGKNAGFLRPDALLAVVILTDEDDQSDDASMNPIAVEQFISTFDSVKGDHAKWATAVIAGPGPGQCMSAFGSAEEGVRLKDFVTKSGQQAIFSSICEGDLAKALDEALHTFQAACDSFPIG
jgi:hypothetical protein